MNSYSLLFSAFVAIGLVLGMIFLLVFRRLRKHAAQLTVVEHLEVVEPELAELELASADIPDTSKLNGTADQAPPLPSPGPIAEVEPQVEPTGHFQRFGLTAKLDVG